MNLNYVDGIHAGFLLILMESKHQRMEIQWNSTDKNSILMG